jgi:hypothetical protein
MAGEDVKVTIGGDLSPIQRTFAQVKVQAAQAGESAGLEFGNRTAYMAERRVSRGMEGVLKSLSTAKDPIDGIAGAIEGLGQSFRISGAAFFGLAIGTFLKEQLEKAAEGATDFYTKLNSVYAVGNNSSKAFLEKSVKDFEDAKAAYGKIGFLEWMIYGAGEKKSLDDAASKNEQNIKQLRMYREAEYKAEADGHSADETVRLQGEIEKVNARYDAEISKARDAGDSVVEIERSKAEEIAAIHEKLAKALEEKANKPSTMDTFEALAGKVQAEQTGRGGDKEVAKQAELQEKLLLARNKFGDLNTRGKDPIAIEKAKLEYEQVLTEIYEHQQEIQAKTNADRQTEANKTTEAIRKGAELQEQIDESGMTEAQKIAALKAKITKEEKETKNFVGPQTGEEAQNRRNKILGDKLKLKELEDPTKKAADKKRSEALLKEQTSAQSELATAQANAMGAGHVVVSSLRREGFGRTPGGGKDSSQLKAVQNSEKHLSDIRTEIAQLNAKIGGTA